MKKTSDERQFLSPELYCTSNVYTTLSVIIVIRRYTMCTARYREERALGITSFDIL